MIRVTHLHLTQCEVARCPYPLDADVAPGQRAAGARDVEWVEPLSDVGTADGVPGLIRGVGGADWRVAYPYL